MQQVFFQETEFLNSVIDYNHKIEAENLCLDIAYGTDKNFLFGCGISIASILKYNEGNQLCFHIFTDYFGDDDRKYFDALARQYKTRIKIYLINGDSTPFITLHQELDSCYLFSFCYRRLLF